MTDKEKIIVITGASSGIGKALINKYLAEGKRVAGLARSVSTLEKMQSDFPDKLFVEKVDVKNNDEVEKAFKRLSTKFNIECLINNAGVTVFKNVIETSIEEFENIINTNLLGSIYSTKAVLPSMIEKKTGTIINIGSVVVDKVFTHSGAYAASKSGLISFTKVLREEIREHGIKIVNVIPGATSTPIWDNGILNKFSERMMKPDDIANMIFDLQNLNSSIVPEEVVIRPMKGDL